MRLTDNKKATELNGRGNHTHAEKIYLKLAKYEDAEEQKNLFTKNQVNAAITKCAEMLGNIVKVQITNEILLTLVAEVKKKETDGKVDFKEVEKIANEIIKRVAKK